MAGGGCLRGLRESVGTGNVRLALVWQVASAVGSSIVNGSVFLSSYIYFLDGAANSNTDVGLVSMSAGLTMVVLAVPVGLLTDRLPRSAVLRASGVFGLLASALLYAALLSDSPHVAMALLYATSVCTGAYNAISGPALSSILADSVASGQRTKIYALQYAATLAAGAVGPLIGLCFLRALGDEWATRPLREVMLAGNVIASVAVLPAFFFDDALSLGAESEGALASPKAQQEGAEAAPHAPGTAALAGDAAVLLLDDDSLATGEGGGSLNGTAVAEPPSQAASSTQNLGHQSVAFGCCTLRVRHVPYLIFCSDFVIAVGAGMTVQFFALFFATDEGMGPMEVAAIWVLCPLLIAAASALAVPASRRFGRAVTAVACDALGAASIFALSLDLPVAAIVAIYLLRTSAMNASYPVQRAILMDLVPKGSRGKWNSLESLTSFTWCGSAAVGGVLVDRFGYRFTFVITGGLYLAATCILALLIPLTYGEVTDQARPGGDSRADDVKAALFGGAGDGEEARV